MILYDSKKWSSVLFNPNFDGVYVILPKVVISVAWACFCAVALSDFHIPHESMSAVFGVISFLAVMRCSDANTKYTAAAKAVSKLTGEMRDVVRVCVSYSRHQNAFVFDEGAAEHGRQLRLSARCATGVIELCWVDTCRLALAIIVAVQLRTILGYRRILGEGAGDEGLILDEYEAAQVGFNRARLRGLLRKNEFEMIDHILGSLELSPDCMKKRKRWVWKRSFLDVHGRTELFKATDGNQCEVFVAVAALLSSNFKRHLIGESCLYLRTFDMIDQKLHNAFSLFAEIEENFALTTPISFAQVNKCLIGLLMIMFPLAIHQMHGVYVNIFLPALGTLVFLMLEYLAIDMEVIFGLGRSHIDVPDNLHQLEAECLAILQFGEEDHFKYTCRRPCVLKEFQWVKLPADYHFRKERNFCKEAPPRWGLALASEAHIAEELYDEISWKTSTQIQGHKNATDTTSTSDSRTGRNSLVVAHDHVGLEVVRKC